jgi:GT2 family glycosyltransferase
MVARCLASLRAALRPDDELVLVDSASQDPAAYAAAAAAHDARLVRVDAPGVNRARNAGWTTTSADVVLFTDDDVEVEQGWAQAYLDCLDDHPEAGFATGWVGVPEGQQDGADVATKLDEQAVQLDRSTRGVLGHGASLAVRRAALEEIGGWDEALGAGGRFRSAPELDLFDRLFAAGWVGRFTPTARARHHQWRSQPELAKLHFRYAMGAGARMAKLRRTDRERLHHVAYEAWWSWGVHDLWLTLRNRDFRRTLLALLRLVGFGAGYVEARPTPVVDGHFRPRS